MNSRTRIRTALEAEEPDRVPLFSNFTELSIDRVAERLELDVDLSDAKDMDYGGLGGGTREMLDRYVAIVRELDLDASIWGFSYGLDDSGEGLAEDKYGIRYHVSDVGTPMPREGPIGGAEDLAAYDMASRLDPEDFFSTRYVAEELRDDDRAHFVGLDDPFAVSWKLRGGMNELLVDYYQDPTLVHDLGETVTDWARRAIDMAADIGADAILLAGDVAGEETTIMSPDHYREFVAPYERAIVDHGHDRGLKVIQHTDGNAWPILDDFVDIGFDGFHPVQPQCMDIGEVKAHLDGAMCVLGNIDCRTLLTEGTTEEVEQTVKETIEIAAPGGGYILSSSNSIHPGVTPENYLAMVRAVKKYGA